MNQRTIPDEIRNPARERLEFSYHPGVPDSATLVVIGHGVTGNKDRPLLVTLAETLSRGGVHALRFSFAGNGGSEGRFEESTITKETADLDAVLDALPGWRIGYAGHSLGAAVGVLRTSQDERVQFLISIAGMAHPGAFVDREFGQVTPGQGCMWDKPECPLSPDWVADMQRVGSVTAAAYRVRVPWLFLHGEPDDVVPIQDSIDLMAASPAPRKLIRFPAADHVFTDQQAKMMARIALNWVRRLQG